MTKQPPASNKPLQLTLPNKAIAVTHLEDVARTAKIRAFGLLENMTFLEAHLDGIPSEYRGMKGIEMVAAVAELMQCLQTALGNMAKTAQAEKQ